MPGNFKYEDIGVLKTKEALMEAMNTLLALRSFKRITLKDLCAEAKVGKATFYYHFQDKYDFFKYWLAKTKSEIISVNGTYKDNRLLAKLGGKNGTSTIGSDRSEIRKHKRVF